MALPSSNFSNGDGNYFFGNESFLFYLTDFKDEQVSEYVQKWFAVDLDLTKEEKKLKGEAFLTESKTVSDLRCNPLMLGLM